MAHDPDFAPVVGPRPIRVAAAIIAAVAVGMLPFASWAGAAQESPTRLAPDPIPAERIAARPAAAAIDHPNFGPRYQAHVNTFGYTTTFDDPIPGTTITQGTLVPLSARPVWDVGGGTPPSSGELRVDVELGSFNRMHETDIADYWMDIAFDAEITTWANGDGKYCPGGALGPPSSQLTPQLIAAITQICPGYYDAGFVGDDACPLGDFPLFDLLVQPNGVGTATPLRTVAGGNAVMGGNMENCQLGSPSESHPFVVLADPQHPSDSPHRFRIPKALLDPDKTACCFVTVIFRPKDIVLPAYTAAHNKSQDGVKLTVHSVMIQLVAPPMVISHGWTHEFDPTDEPPVPWQPVLKANLIQTFTEDFGQDPWAWAAGRGEPVLLNVYPRKQDFRLSADELALAVTKLKHDMHWTGKVWMHGHSMGGLLSRYYIEELGGTDQVEKFSQDASPNTGSFGADWYTWWRQLLYAEHDGYTLGRYVLGNSHPVSLSGFSIFHPFDWFAVGPLRCWFHSGLYFWKPWYNTAYDNTGDVGAYKQKCGPGFEGLSSSVSVNGSRMADFELKSAGWRNPILWAMNDQFFSMALHPGSLPPYFAPPSQLNNSNGNLPAMLPPYFTVRASYGGWEDFDGAVPFASATLNGAIPSRTIDSWHEDTPASPDTAVFLERYYGNLDIDNGYPHFCRPQAPPGPPVVANPGDNTTLTGGSVSVGTLHDLRFEEYGGRAPSCPVGSQGCVNAGDEQDPASTVGADRYDVFVDAQTYAKFTIGSALEDPPLHFDAVSPTGQPAPVATTAETGFGREQTIAITSPQAGQWTIHVGAAAGQLYTMALYWDSPLQLTAGTALATNPAHTPVTFTAKLSGTAVSVAQASVYAEVTDATGNTVHVPLSTFGSPTNENWSGTWVPPSIIGPSGELACEGDYLASVTATGNRGTVAVPTPDFTRSVEIDVHVAGDPADAALCDPPPPPPGSTGDTPVVLVGVPVIGILLGGFGGGFLVGRRRPPGLNPKVARH